MLIVRRAKLYYTASGIITHMGGRPVHRLREEYVHLLVLLRKFKYYFNALMCSLLHACDVLFVLLCVHLCVLSVFFVLKATELQVNFIISLFQASTCFEHMCSSSGGQNCIIQSLVSSHL